VAQWVIERNGVRVEPRVVHRAIEVPPGQNGLDTLRVLGELVVDPPAVRTRRVTVHVVDRSYAQREGVRDLRADDSDAARLVSAPPELPVRGADGTTLRRVNEATFVFELRAPPPSTAPPAVAQHVTGHGRWIALVASSLAWLLALTIGLARREADSRVRVVLTLAFAIAAGAARADSNRALALLAAFALTGAVAVRPAPSWFARRVALALVWGLAFGATRALASPVHSFATGARLAARIAITLLATVPLAATTTVTRLAEALAGLPVPAIFADTTVSTVRGLALLRAEGARIARARILRAPDAGIATRIALFGSYAGAVFERGLARASRADLAYALRVANGTRRTHRRAPARDVIALVCALAALVLAVMFA
jgi:energy-coupling factor transporter transmembrane protein EcfT